MSNNIPFEIQAEIFKRLPVISLIQIRSVCKAWKFLIDSDDFIKNYSGQMQYLLARYKDNVDFQEKYVLIDDNHTFPQNRVSLNTHHLVNMLKYSRIIGCSHGLLCLYGGYQEGHDGPLSGTCRAVLWNPSIRKAVAVAVPNVADMTIYETGFGFGVCRETNDPKIVKITHINMRGHRESVTCIPWQVEVFPLSTGAWRSPYTSNLPRNSIEFDYDNTVVIYGMLYWLATDRITADGGFQSYNNLIISFDMTSEEFREVNLPDSLAHQSIDEANNLVFRVWTMTDVVPKLFTKLFTIDIPYNVSEVYVTGFRKTGEPIIDSLPRHPEWTGSLAVYEPCSNSINSLGIDGRDFSHYVYSYIESLLLL
ncbi:putative F-box domain-containing protein [Helianthus annuus]|uniref:F-box domain-containing protein n=1 Tax=Helianthus annuus TaxID=4232 RepID=A0A9K3IVA8_HELAN|nr:putative F-box domain-containing protein [Helianthus annuus]KAJ0561746.1 putative F-box domain-containing protein [Helianthus annuus]KAJ0568494.1 putative F-box domain-containing protein [Helianthus annuus]KAJ0574810.1 putative F-box domain-containing protein [Helianthus annuus]KAJ0739141.1 putative F-box domain-containing protein [Helianthus annuus]